MAQVRREFRRMDSNHDGTISREEFRATAEKLFYEREFPKWQFEISSIQFKKTFWIQFAMMFEN